MLSDAETALFVVGLTLLAALPFLFAERRQRRYSRAMQKNVIKRARAS
jgi:hypothetical protein